jgi:hypothetical protein
MDAPAVLRIPEQKMVAWMPKRHAEKYVRRQGGEIIDSRIAGFNKDMEPVTHYLVMYNRPRFTGFGA